MAKQTATAFPKFQLLSSELRHSIWEALWDIIKDEERTEELMLECMQNGKNYILVGAHPPFAACAESRRIFVNYILKEFRRTIEEIQAGLVSLRCKNTTLPQITISKIGEGFWIEGNNVFQACYSMFCLKDRYKISLNPASKEEEEDFFTIFRKWSGSTSFTMRL
jgi:hypothetical protein